MESLSSIFCLKIAEFFAMFSKFANFAKFIKISQDVSQILCTKSEEKQVEKQVRYRKFCRNFAGICPILPDSEFEIPTDRKVRTEVRTEKVRKLEEKLEKIEVRINSF